jgi:hypothetical protein
MLFVKLELLGGDHLKIIANEFENFIFFVEFLLSASYFLKLIGRTIIISQCKKLMQEITKMSSYLSIRSIVRLGYRYPLELKAFILHDIVLVDPLEPKIFNPSLCHDGDIGGRMPKGVSTPPSLDLIPQLLKQKLMAQHKLLSKPINVRAGLVRLDPAPADHLPEPVLEQALDELLVFDRDGLVPVVEEKHLGEEEPAFAAFLEGQ